MNILLATGHIPPPLGLAAENEGRTQVRADSRDPEEASRSRTPVYASRSAKKIRELSFNPFSAPFDINFDIKSDIRRSSSVARGRRFALKVDFVVKRARR